MIGEAPRAETELISGTAPVSEQRAADGRPRLGPNLAVVVAAGILLSRISGLVRESIFAHYLGNSAAADAFKAGFRIPNILQNLFGEGVLSASFIPVYSRLLSEGNEEAADLVAWAVGAILAGGTALLVLLGVAGAPWLIDAIAPGFHGNTRELTVRIVQVLFPGAGMLVMSAWCLGVLNSHRRFFASYAAPVAWNVAIIAALLLYGPRASQPHLAIDVAWGSVAGALLQILVQLPQTLPLLGRLRLHYARVQTELRVVFDNLLPVIASRGVAQVSGYIDNLLASLLPTGAVAALNYAQILYLLPISLFGMSVAAAELPTMSRATVSSATGEISATTAEILRSPAQRRPAPDLLPGRPVGCCLSFHRRRNRGVAFRIGRIRSSRRNLRLVDSGGVGGRNARGNNEPPLQFYLLRALGYADASEVRAGAGHPDFGAWLPVRDHLAARIGGGAALGCRRFECFGGSRGVGRIFAPAMETQSTAGLNRA